MCVYGLDWKTWRRPTFPRLKPQYHRRWGFSRPSSGWDRVDHSPPWPPGRPIQPVGGRVGLVLWCVCRVLWVISMHVVSACLTKPVVIEPIGRLGPVSAGITAFTHLAYRRDGLSRPSGRPSFEVSFSLRCFQRLSCPHVATRPCRWRDNRCTRGASIPVLSY